MEKTYQLQGSSYGGCVNSLKRALLQVPHVQEAEVHLHPQRAVLTMSKSVDVDELQAQLSKAGHYTITQSAHLSSPQIQG